MTKLNADTTIQFIQLRLQTKMAEYRKCMSEGMVLEQLKPLYLEIKALGKKLQAMEHLEPAPTLSASQKPEPADIVFCRIGL